eukprot:12537649-Alexandrium_andersonii.AAC.1
MSCEVDRTKRAFIALNHEPHHLYTDVHHLRNEYAADDMAGGRLTKVPLDVDVVICGWSCKDLSTLNPHRSEHGDVLSKKRGSSGSTLH